jgi:threonine/homoserine/homoserine lactone efflux protein
MTDAIIYGLILGLALVFSVGPVVFTIIKLRINYGIKSAFYFISGVWLSDIIMVFLANFFGEFMGRLIEYKKSIGLVGGIFLIGLGVFYLFFKRYKKDEKLEAGVRISSTTNVKLLITGFLINTLNPSVIGLWLAASTKSIGQPIDEKIAIFSVCLTINILADILKINLAGKLKKSLTERNIHYINIISGLLFIAFGIVLMVSVLYTPTK